MVRTIMMCCALYGSQGAGEVKAPGPESPDPARATRHPLSSLAAMPMPTLDWRLWCEAHGLDGRASQASFKGGPVRPDQCPGSRSDGACRLSRQMGKP